MSQETRSSSTDRQARIRAAKMKRAMFKLVLLIALLAIFGVLYLKIHDTWANINPPNFYGQLTAAHPIPKRVDAFDPSKVDTSKLLASAPTPVSNKLPDSGPKVDTNTVKNPTVKHDYTDDAWGQDVLKRAQGYYDDTNFTDGTKVLQEVSQKAINPELLNKLLDLRRRCEQFDRAIKHIQPLNMAREDNQLQLWQVAMGNTDYLFNVPKSTGNGPLFGEAIKASAPVSIGSMKLEFDPNDDKIAAKKITRDDLVKNFREYFQSVEAASGMIGDPNTCYDLVFLACKMCLKPEAIKYLETADKMCQAHDVQIDNVFRDRCIALALEKAVFYDNLNQRGPAERILKEMVDSMADYPKALSEADELRAMFTKNAGRKTHSTVHLAQTASAEPKPAKPADDDGELSVGPVKVTGDDGQTTNVPTQTDPAPAAPVGMAAASAARGSRDIAFDDISSDGAKAADKIAQGNKLFRDGIDAMRKGTNMNGGEDNQSLIAKAADDLDKAADAYDAAGDANKGSNKGLADQLYSRSAEAGEYAYGMHKRQTLNFYPGAKR